jgi:hypothetical protein
MKIILLLTFCLLITSCNPFAPKYDPNGFLSNTLLGNRNTVDGIFQFFKSSYELRDTVLYGKMFSQDFIFTYYDFEQSVPISWDRAQELNTTYNLFRNTQQIILDWNYYVQKDTTPLEASIIRSFNLTIVQNDNSVLTGTGRARFNLRRVKTEDPWEIYFWFDDSDF